MSHLVHPPVGLAFYFNGTDAYIQPPTSSLINTASVLANRTIEVLFMPMEVERADHQVVYEEGGAVRGFNIYILNGTLYVGAWNEAETGWQGDWISYQGLQNFEWYHVFLILRDATDSITADKLELYVNGSLIGTAPGTRVYAHSGAIGVGAVVSDSKFHDIGDFSGNGKYFKGCIAMLRIYNKALEATEIADRVNIGREIKEELVLKYGAYGIVRGGGSKWLDESGNSLHGTVNGAIRVRCCHCNPIMKFGTATPI